MALGLVLTKFSGSIYKTMYSENLEKETLTKISNKTLLTITQGALEVKKDNSSSALIPLTELGMVSFVYLVKILDQLYAINFITQTESQLKLYKYIPLLELNAKKFLKELENTSPTDDLDINSNETLKNLFSDLQKNAIGYIDQNTIEENSSPYSLFSLIKILGSGISPIYRALLLNANVVIFSEKNVNILEYPWKLLVPHKNLNIIAYPENPRSINEFDIMIVEPNKKKECDVDCVVLDLSANKFENGKLDKYLANFFNYLLEIKSDPSIELHLEINNIFNWVNEIIEVATKEKDDKKIKELIVFHSKTRFGNRLPLVTSIARKYNQFTADRISTYFMKELGLFDKEITRIDTKKLISKL